MNQDKNEMFGKICIVTGATSGIGKVTARVLAEKGATVLFIGRNKEKCESTLNSIVKKTSNKNVSYLVADLSSQKDIHNISKEIHKIFTHVDVLVNNAGARFLKNLKSVDGIEMTFALNHLAYFLLTNLLLDLLKKSESARIVNVSSSYHHTKINFEDIQLQKNFDGRRAYAQSKLANILFTMELSKKLKNTNITSNCLHPGGVASRFSLNNGLYPYAKHILIYSLRRKLLSSEKGAITSVYLASSKDMKEISGEYFYECKPVPSIKNLYDEKVSKKLWQISEELTGLN